MGLLGTLAEKNYTFTCNGSKLSPETSVGHGVCRRSVQPVEAGRLVVSFFDLDITIVRDAWLAIASKLTASTKSS